MSDAYYEYDIAENPRIQSQSPENSAKRQRIAVACDPCRIRKVKCNGERPVCDVCQRRKHKRGANCRYSDRSQRPFVSAVAASQNGKRTQQQYESVGSPSNLQARSFHALEADGLNISETSLDLSLPKAGTENLNLLEGQTILETDLSHETPRDASRRRRKNWTANSSPKAPISSKNISNDSHDQGFLESSSADSFMIQITSAIDRKAGVYSPLTPNSITSRIAQAKEASARTTGNGTEACTSSILPARKTADQLMDVYWRLVYPIYPFLERQKFEEVYKSIWLGSYPEKDEKILLSTLNMVLALGCQLSESIKPEYREDAAESYFKQARELIQSELWKTESTEMVQCLLLMGQYLHSTNTPHGAFMVVGQAIRVAQSLGFHLTGSRFDRHSVHDRELARMIWHGCVLMDRIISMTFGRPTMVSTKVAEHVPLPTELEFNNQGSPAINASLLPANQPKMIKTFFIRSLQLYGIMNDILLAFYAPNDEGTQESEQTSEFPDLYLGIDFATVLRLDQALMMWNWRLPPYLCFPQSEGDSNPMTRRQAIVCKLRFLHARITLFRPVLVQVCGIETSLPGSQTPTGDSLKQSIALQCSRICLQAAHDTIHLVYSYLAGDLQSSAQLSELWFSIFYLNTAATVLLAARLQPKVEACTPNYSIDTSLSQALDILRMFEPFGQPGRRASAALEILTTKVRQQAVESVDNGRVNQQIVGSGDALEPRFGNNFSQAIYDVDPYNFNVGEIFDFNGIDFNLNDMSWLNSMPARL